MNEILNYVASVAKIFKHQLGTSLVDVYKVGSLAHGGFSQVYSDIDIGMVLSSPAEPEGINRLIYEAKGLEADLGKRLSVFWGNPAHDWGRLRVLDRLDLLDHGVPLDRGHTGGPTTLPSLWKAFFFLLISGFPTIRISRKLI
ncbi:MAG: nucleotidyltransferase domain-containing protein [Candidatus Binatia bacterium]